MSKSRSVKQTKKKQAIHRAGWSCVSVSNRTPIYVRSDYNDGNADLNKTLRWPAHRKTHSCNPQRTHTHACMNTHTSRSSRTFQAADPPEAGVCERARVLLVLVVGVLLRWVGRAVADEGARVQPVVRTDGHRHQGEGGERSHGCQQHLNASLTPHQRRARKETDIWEGNRRQSHLTPGETSAQDAKSPTDGSVLLYIH